MDPMDFSRPEDLPLEPPGMLEQLDASEQTAANHAANREAFSHYRVRLDLELVNDTDEPAAMAFVKAFACALMESV